MDGGQVGGRHESRVHEPDQQLRQIEPDCERALEGDVDGDHGAGLTGGDEQVLRAGIAMRQRLRELIEMAEYRRRMARELKQIGTQFFPSASCDPGVLPQVCDFSHGITGRTTPS